LKTFIFMKFSCFRISRHNIHYRKLLLKRFLLFRLEFGIKPGMKLKLNKFRKLQFRKLQLFSLTDFFALSLVESDVFLVLDFDFSLYLFVLLSVT